MKANILLKGLAAIALLGLPILASAQDYEDDIYYNPSKSTKSKTTKTTTNTQRSNTESYVSQPNYAAADTYSFSTGSTRDVDEYNRHSNAVYADTLISGPDSLDVNEFGYTRRIERFHNPNVVVNTGDSDLIDYYYSTDASSDGTNINIYVVDDPFYYSAWRYPYYGWSRWNNWCYSPWYWDTYYGWGGFGWSYFDPFYSWSWGWGPSFGFGWNWGWGGWHGGWASAGHGWHGGGGWHATTPGAGRVHTPGNVGSSINSARRSSYSINHNGSSSWSRPGNMGRGTGNSTSAFSTNSRNNNRNNGVTSTTTGRGRFGSSTSNNNNNNSNSYNSNSSSRRSSSSFGNSSTSSSRGSGSSWGGSRGGGGSMGGGSHGGGGGGRGRH